MFKVGDRVRVKIGAVEMGFPHIDTMRCYEGKKGVVCGISKNAYGVKMDCDPLHEWWWLKCAVEPVTEEIALNPTWRIIIEGDENTSRAKYIVGKKVIKEVSAKRYHKDAHDPGMAAAALIGKMFPHTAEKPEPPKRYTGRVVCVKSPHEDVLRVGKIYECVDGRLKCEPDHMVITEIESVEHLNERCNKRGMFFIEIKED